MSIGKARLYGGGSPATGEPAQITAHGDHIEVRVGERAHCIAIDKLRVREIGTGESGLEFSWDTDAGLCAVQVFDAQTLSELLSPGALVSAPQLLTLRAGQRRAAFGRSIGWTALAAFVLLPVLLVLGFLWQTDRIALAAAARIPIEQEVKLGEQAFTSMRDSLTLQDSSAAYDAVHSLGQRLTQGSKYPYRFHVVKDAAINAFALPGGIVVVHTGLIQATRKPEELVGVLAHEVQHVERRHSLQALVKNLGLRGLWLLVTGDVGGTLLGQATLELNALRFSRDAEEEADTRGFDTLLAHHIDPSGMADFFTVLAKQNAAEPLAFLSTHPASADREQRLRARVEALGERRFEPLQLGSWPPQ